MFDTYFHCHVPHGKYQTGEFLPQDFKEFRFSQISSSAELRQEIHIHSKRKNLFCFNFHFKMNEGTLITIIAKSYLKWMVYVSMTGAKQILMNGGSDWSFVDETNNESLHPELRHVKT